MIRYGIYLFFGLVIALGIAFSGLLYLYVGIENKYAANDPHKPITIVHNDAVTQVIVRDDVNVQMKRLVRRVVDIFYSQATIHNPKGDLIPDALDDTAKEILREKL